MFPVRDRRQSLESANRLFSHAHPKNGWLESYLAERWPPMLVGLTRIVHACEFS